MNGTPQLHSPNIDTDIFVAVVLPHHDPEVAPTHETVRYDQFVRWLFKPGTDQVMALHCAIGLAGEVGELVEDRKNAYEELGDIEFYLQALRNHYEISRAHILTSLYPSFAPDCLISDRLMIACGEICDVIKREYIYGKPRDIEALAVACARFEYALELYRYTFCAFGKSSDDHRKAIIQANAEKLGKRYVSLRYSDEQAIARADKKENK
jgi:hypothetical protein